LEQANGTKQRMEFDVFGRLRTLYNEKGEAYRFAYNPLGQLIREHRIDGTQKVYEYDVLGEVVQQVDVSKTGQRQTTLFYRDKIGRLIAKENNDYRTNYHYQDNKLLIEQTTLIN